MPRNDKKMNRVNRRIQNIATNVQSNMNSLYTTTYFSTPRARDDVKNIAQDINDTIDGIVSRNMDTIGLPSVSVLYSRIFNKSGALGQSSLTNGISSMFEDPMMMDDLYATFMSNRFLKELDEEIDTVCKYMPELEEALNTKKDAVLSADHFSKDFLNIKFPTDISGFNTLFAQRAKDIKKKYKLQKLVEEIYEDTAKYGEKFIYCVPYSAAITKLLAQKPQTSMVQKPYARMESVTESQIKDAFKNTSERYVFTMDSSNCKIINDAGSVADYGHPTMLKESVEGFGDSKKTIMKPVSILDTGESFKLGIEINTSGIIESAITEAASRIRIQKKTPKSLREAHMESVEANRRAIHEANPEAKGNLNIGDVFQTNFADNPVNDGLIGDKGSDADFKKYEVRLPGAVVKVLKREYVIPIYIEESCMGYYYIELRTKDAGDEMMGFRNLLGDPMTGMSSEGRVNFNAIDNLRQEETIKYVASQLSRFIDKKFVNNNQDLAKEIYEILKYNDLFNTPSLDLIKVTFVPPEDIHHSYFKLDPDSHRGISDFAKGMIPAKLYASLYVTNSIGIMTRGQDKRVYYVKQMVDTNIAQQLMNVINQIKMGNFGIRQFNSINTILNITGRFNDYVIPTSPSGDSPINVDVIQGQQFDVHTDLMDILKSMAIDSTEVPIEIVQTRNSVDYASQLSMSSSKFLRVVYKRQERFQEIISPLITNIYNYEYDENDDLDVAFPPPVFLDMANTNQLITNTKDFVDSIIDVEMPNEEETLKSKYRQNLFMHYIGTHIDISAHKNILDQTKVEIKEEQKESEVAQAEAPEDTGGDAW